MVREGTRGDARSPRGRPTRSPADRRALEFTIAHEALRLFLERGVDATTVADIAAAAGVSPRTYWRHFSSKESAIRPFLDHGLRDAVERMSGLTPGSALSEGWAGESTLDDAALGTIVSLVRMVQHELGLRAVWLQAHHDAALAFVPLVARHLSVSPESLEAQVTSAELNAALATAVEHFTLRNVEGLSLNETIRRAVLMAID
jgi:AcrR family transcriptional regulator